MPLFLVVALQTSAPAIDAAVASHFSDDAYKIEPGIWAINADVTTGKELSVKLGIRETQNHIIIPMRTYFGRAKPDLWEWLSAQSAKVDA
jgi:hypothetical protein